MSGWQNSRRRQELPPNWDALRKRILGRDDHSCQWDLGGGQKCGREAREVDHIRRGSDHSESNLRALCHWHHLRKSGGEGAQATAAQRRVNAQKFRRTEEHPGLL